MQNLLSRSIAFFTPLRCRLAAATLYTSMIVLGSIPGSAQSLSAEVPDKLLHFCAYAILSALVYGSLPGQSARGLLTVVISGALGALDESIQTLFPYREASLLDWYADLLASLFSAVTMIFLNFLYSTMHPKKIASQEDETRSSQPKQHGQLSTFDLP